MVSLWWAVPAAVAAFLAGQRAGRARPTVLALVAVVAAGVVAVALVPSWLPLGSRFVAVVVVAAMLPWFAGRFRRQYRQLVRAGWERAAQLEREQRLVAEQARLRERARIAHDMHDVLGHDLSLIALSAGALSLAADLDDRHRRAAGDIRARAGAAVERLGEVISVLRDGTDDAPLSPTGTPDEGVGGGAGAGGGRGGPAASVSRVARLADEASASGLSVDLRVDGRADRVPPVVERAVHRVVQEALTNVAKHAPHTTARVRVAHSADETEVVVENGPSPGAAPAVPPGSGAHGGHGLIGLDERVRLAGGTFTHGPRDGGFAVAARIPHTPSRPVAPVTPITPVALRSGGPGGEGGALPREHRHAGRRVRRTLVAAVLVPLVAGASLSLVLMGWEMWSVSRSVLEPGDFARLRVGMARSEAEPLLPERRTGHRPVEAEPAGPGTSCSYYAMTADRFDDRSGDAYRLCFRDDTLVSADALTP
ncbi:histidine kinase [Streptomyces sp. NBC_00654]|uniref:sensor histidine kinase n=1 Tax=Streptomyces sp. NBC_00654 TaxID=2975799 RepID=UPI00224C851C|nr:histidine kinase [Streptomyces sp. NBC_00654]MCX4970137.1 histidine kinase [Streptomyces sp. NBC_00654]